MLSITAGRRSAGNNETWWWNGKVQEVIKAMKEAMKMWETSVRQIATGRQTRGNERSRTAKARAMNELYEELETPECERKISRIAKAKDFTKNNQIKEEYRVLWRDLDRIWGRWKGYYDKLLNGENHRFDPDGVPNDGLTQRIGRNEVLKSNLITNEERRDNGNGWDSRRCVDVFGRRRDWHVINLMQSVYEQENISLQHKPLSTTEGQRVALMNVWSFTEIWGDSINSGCGTYRRGLVPRRKNCLCDLMMGCASADIADGTARTSIVRHSLLPIIPSESSICHTNLGTNIYILVCFISWSGYWLMPVIMRIMWRSGPGFIWTPCILLMTPIEYPLHSFSTFHYFLFKCIWVPGMCPEPRWIDYPAPRSPADSFVMAGPIRHCLLQACRVITRNIISSGSVFNQPYHYLCTRARVQLACQKIFG